MSETRPEPHRFVATPGTGEVSALLQRPAAARSLLVLAHGAGAGMTHPFMQAVADGLSERRVATLRFQFPYMEAGRRRPDPAARSQLAVRNAVAEARRLAPDLPLFAGGKSYGGRMTSQAAAEAALEGVAGLVFLGFPLHAPGKDGAKRGAHLAEVPHAMLFVQGTRDRLANLDLLQPLLAGLGERATLHLADGGDHSFKVLKRSGRSNAEALAEVVGAVAGWVGDRVDEMGRGGPPGG